MEKPKADIFWNANKWYWIDVAESICPEYRGSESMHDAIVEAIDSGYEIRDVRKTRGSVKVGTQYV